MSPLRDRLAENRVIRLDGGLSTALERLGADLDDPLWTARALRDTPELVLAAHKAFVDAGAEIVISASYQAPEHLIAKSVEIARQAGALVAGSIGPYGAVLGGGQEYTGDYDVPTGWHEARLQALRTADCIAIETQPRADEAAQIVRTLERLDGPDAWVTFTCRDDQRTHYGDRIEDAVEAVASPKVVAVGVNCTAPAYVDALLQRIEAVTDLPLVAYPNAGRTYDPATKTWSGETSACTFKGATIVGGCCGWGPKEIGALHATRRPRRA